MTRLFEIGGPNQAAHWTAKMREFLVLGCLFSQRVAGRWQEWTARGHRLGVASIPYHHHQEGHVERWATSATESSVHDVFPWWVLLGQCRTHFAREALHGGEDVIDSLRHEVEDEMLDA